MGTPERQKPVSPVVVIKGEATYFPEELSEAEWKELVRSALSALGQLKYVSGFMEFSQFLDGRLGRRFRQVVNPNKIQFYSDGLGRSSLCRKMATVYSSEAGRRKDEQELFLLKEGGFALFSGSYIFYSMPIPGGESEWRAFNASLQAVGQEDLPVLSAKSENPCLFWANLFGSIYELSLSDHEQKQARALIAQTSFDRIRGMRSKIVLPESRR